MTFTLSLTLIFRKCCVENLILVSQGSDHAAALCGIGGAGNIRSLLGKPFFLLNLDALPWWVAQHHVEASRPARLLVSRKFAFCWYTEYVREGQVPVEEAVLLSQAENFILHPGRDTVGILLDGAENFFGNWISNLAILLPDEGGTPGIGQETSKEIVAGLHQSVVILLFAVDTLDGVIANFF